MGEVENPIRVSDEEFKLDISKFEFVINKCRELADKMNDLKIELDTYNEDLMSSWIGKGRIAFEKKYVILKRQFGDIKDDLYEISEALLADEEAYIQADVDLSKALDGVQTREF